MQTYFLLFACSFISIFSSNTIENKNTPEHTYEIITVLDLPEVTESVFFKHRKGILDEDTYNAVFDTKNNNLPTVDFSIYKVVGVKDCQFCIKSCADYYHSQVMENNFGSVRYYTLNLEEHENQCHRNACTEAYNWVVVKKASYPYVEFDFLRSKQTMRIQDNIRITSEAEYEEFKLKYGNFFPEIDLTKYDILCRVATGDCAASFDHKVMQDSTQNTVTWTLYETYGGCCSSRIWEFSIQIPKSDTSTAYQFEFIGE